MVAIERFFHYLESKNLRHTPVEKELGLSNGYLGKMKSRKASIGSDIIEKIVSFFPDLNINWLVTGKGDMLNDEKSGSDTNAKPHTKHSFTSPRNIPAESLHVRIAVLEAENKNLQKMIEDKQALYQQIIENKQVELDRCLSEIEKKQSIIEGFISGRITAAPCSDSKGSE